MKPSTRAFYREGRRIPGYSFFDFVHGYIYGRWAYLYISIGTGRHPLARKIILPLLRLWGRIFPAKGPTEPVPGTKAVPGRDWGNIPAQPNFADTYHGKVVPLEAARQLVSVQEDIRLPDLEPVLPYHRARDLILQNPEHIVVLECPCRAAREAPCLPLDVCLIIGEPFASFVNEHHPQRSRRITPVEAVEILRAEDERGHVHHAFFKDAMLGRFYAICNCCRCCCGAMQAHHGGSAMLTSSGFVARVEEEACIACGACAPFCQFGALNVELISRVDESLCMGCGVCVSKCPQEAISLQRDAARGEPLEIVRLMEDLLPITGHEKSFGHG